MIGLSLNTAAYVRDAARGDLGYRQGTMGSGGEHWHDAVANATSRYFAAGGSRCASAVEQQLYQLVKDTSLAATIQVPELFRRAQLITSRTLEVFTMYLAASLIYWVMATVLSALQNYFENQLNRRRESQNECYRSHQLVKNFMVKRCCTVSTLR